MGKEHKEDVDYFVLGVEQTRPKVWGNELGCGRGPGHSQCLVLVDKHLPVERPTVQLAE